MVYSHEKLAILVRSWRRISPRKKAKFTTAAMNMPAKASPSYVVILRNAIHAPALEPEFMGSLD